MDALSEHDKAILNCVFNPNLPLDEVLIQEPQELKDDEEDFPELEEVKKLELESIDLTEKCDLDGGLKKINEAIELAPQKASLYNNRAHIYQFQRRFDEAFEDLTKAIDLAGETQKRTLCQSLCQRGLLHRRAERLELARSDFEKAAKMGNQFAKSQLVEINPYAALCNQMLRQVMERL